MVVLLPAGRVRLLGAVRLVVRLGPVERHDRPAVVRRGQRRPRRDGRRQGGSRGPLHGRAQCPLLPQEPRRDRLRGRFRLRGRHQPRHVGRFLVFVAVHVMCPDVHGQFVPHLAQLR